MISCKKHIQILANRVNVFWRLRFKVAKCRTPRDQLMTDFVIAADVSVF